MAAELGPQFSSSAVVTSKPRVASCGGSPALGEALGAGCWSVGGVRGVLGVEECWGGCAKGVGVVGGFGGVVLVVVEVSVSASLCQT